MGNTCNANGGQPAATRIHWVVIEETSFFLPRETVLVLQLIEFVSCLYGPVPIGFEGGGRGMTTGRSYHSLLPELSSTLHTHTHTEHVNIPYTHIPHTCVHTWQHICAPMYHTHTPHEQTTCTVTTQWHMCTDTAGNISMHTCINTHYTHSLHVSIPYTRAPHSTHTCVYTQPTARTCTHVPYTQYTHTHVHALWALYWGIRTASLWCASSRSTVQLFPSSAFFLDPEPCPGLWSWRGYDPSAPRMESEELRSLLPDSRHRIGLSSLC